MNKNQVVCLVLLFLLCGCSLEKTNWYLDKTGEVLRVEYLQGNYWESTKTIIYFTDGSTYVMEYKAYSLPKKLKIYKADRVRAGDSFKVEEEK